MASRPAGQDPDEASGPLRSDPLTLCLQRKSSRLFGLQAGDRPVAKPASKLQNFPCSGTKFPCTG